MRYINSPEYRHDGAERIGVLLVNSGTPATPEPRDVRAFLRGLLSDPRVVELPRALWLPLLYGFILPFRPHRVAVKYRKIWTSQGSPLVVYSNRLRADLATSLAQRLLAPLTVEFAMLYAKPTVPEALQKLRDVALRGDALGTIFRREQVERGVSDRPEPDRAGDQSLRDAAELLGLGVGGLDALVRYEVRRQRAEHRAPMTGVTPELTA